LADHQFLQSVRGFLTSFFHAAHEKSPFRNDRYKRIPSQNFNSTFPYRLREPLAIIGSQNEDGAAADNNVDQYFTSIIVVLFNERTAKIRIISGRRRLKPAPTGFVN